MWSSPEIVVDPYPLAANRNLLAVPALDRLAKDDLSAIDIANLDETPFIGRTGVLDLTAFAGCSSLGQQHRDDRQSRG